MRSAPSPSLPALRRLRRELAAGVPALGLPPEETWPGPPAGLDLGRDALGARIGTPFALEVAELPPERALLAGARTLELRAPDPDAAAHAALVAAALERLGWPGAPAEARLELRVPADLDDATLAPLVEQLEGAGRLDRLLAALPPDLADLADLELRPRLVDVVTLALAPGAPLERAVAAAQRLVEGPGVHVRLEVEASSLGAAVIAELLGPAASRLPDAVPAGAPDLAEIVAALEALRGLAGQRGLGVGVKVVDGARLAGLPAAARAALATQTLVRLRARVPLVGPAGEAPVEFALATALDPAGLASAVEAGCGPVVATGGPALRAALGHLEARMRTTGARDLATHTVRAHGEAERAMAPLAPLVRHEAERHGLAVGDGVEARLALAAERASPATPTTLAAALALAGVEGPLAALVEGLWVHHAGTLGALQLAERALDALADASSDPVL